MKIVKRLLGICFASAFMFSNVVYANDISQELTIDECKQIIKEVNDEYNAEFNLLDSDETVLTEFIRNDHLTREEFRNNLINAYYEINSEDTLSGNILDKGDECYSVNMFDEIGDQYVKKYQEDGFEYHMYEPRTDDSILSPLSVQDDIRQTQGIGNNTKVVLNSTVYSSSGAKGSFKYKKIKSYGVSYPNDADVHFEEMSMSHKLVNNKKKCDVTAKGVLKTKDGVSYGGYRTIKVTFTAG